VTSAQQVNSGADGKVRIKEGVCCVDSHYRCTYLPRNPPISGFSIHPMRPSPIQIKSSSSRAGFPGQAAWVAVSILLVLFVWWLILQVWELPTFRLPPPGLVFQRFVDKIGDGSLLRHTWYTLREVLLGLLLGSAAATVLGYALSRSPLLERLLSPYLVASQAIPTVAIAPLLVIWFGPGMFSKVLICALIVFFPILVNTMVGLRSVPDNLRDLLHSLQATRSQVLFYLEIPASLPVFLGGLRIGATLSVIGAVVGEFVGSDRGLGFLVNVARGQYDTALVFVATFTLITLALLLYGSVRLLESLLLHGQIRP